MKWLLFALGLVAMTTALGTRAQAQNYPWCARYSFRDGATSLASNNAWPP